MYYIKKLLGRQQKDVQSTTFSHDLTFFWSNDKATQQKAEKITFFLGKSLSLVPVFVVLLLYCIVLLLLPEFQLFCSMVAA